MSLKNLEDFFGCNSPPQSLKQGPVEDSRFPSRNLRLKVWDSGDYIWAEQIVRHYHACLQQLTTITHQPSSSQRSSIPKIFHFIWIGPSPIPQIHNTTAIQSFKKLHPDWTVHIWNEDDILALPLQNRDAFQAATGNYGRQSDIARYEVLYNHGGVYVDMDYRCTDTLDDLNQRYEFYCGASNAGTVELNNGIIGCIKGHWLMSGLIARIKEWHSRRSKIVSSKNSLLNYLDDHGKHTIESMSQVRDVMDTIEFTGPGVFTRVICQNLSEGQIGDDVMILPARVFHPFPNHLRHFAADEDVVDQFTMVGETKAVHLWACSWH